MSSLEHHKVTAFARARMIGRAPTHRHATCLGAMVVGLFALLQAGPSRALPIGTVLGQQAAPAPISAVDKQQALKAYGKLPLVFVPNAGRTDPRVRFSAEAGRASFWFTPKEAVFSFAKKKGGINLRLRFLGANPAAAVGGTKLLPGKVNYLLGKDRVNWHTGLPTYAGVVYHNLWSGIDLAFRGGNGKLKYEFRLAPGARASDIRLAYRGADRLALGRAGDLRIHTAAGVLRDSRPVSYQLIGGRRVPVDSRYILNGGRGYGFAAEAYDARYPLVIDPGLVYSTYLGGAAFDEGKGIAIDSAGNAYVTGHTSSGDFPTTFGVIGTSLGGAGDAFVTKVNATGTGLVYSTYLGGSSDDQGLGIAIDATGNAYATGTTQSGDFPTTTGAPDTSYGGAGDAFVTKLNPTGTALVYSTYLGGSGFDEGLGIAVGAGSAYVTGLTYSGDFPTTLGAFDTTYSAGAAGEGFVTNVNATGSALLYSTYLGGSRDDSVAVDATGNAYVTGFTYGVSFPTTSGALDTSYNGSGDAFVTKVNPTGSGLVYSTFLGGTGADEGNSIALDASGNAYVTGDTSSADFPTTLGAFDTSLGGAFDAFVTKLDMTGSALAYSTYLGGSSTDEGFGIAVDDAGNAYLTGFTQSGDFPTTAGAFDTSLGGGSDVFVTKMSATGSALAYSTYLGGSSVDQGFGIAVDATGNAYVTGSTQSGDFPTTGAFDTSLGGAQDAFVTKLSTAGVGPPATLDLSPAAATNTVGTTHTVKATVKDAASNPVQGVVVRFTVTGSVNTTGTCTTGLMGACKFTYAGPSLPGTDAISAYADTNNNSVHDFGEPEGAATKTWVLPESTPGCEVKIIDNGKITALNGDTASFHGQALVSSSGVSGTQRYEDRGPAQPLTMQSINVLTAVCSADRTDATMFGQATIDGSGSFFYRIHVKDIGEPGKGRDIYGILLSNGYSSGDKTLESGNVQIIQH